MWLSSLLVHPAGLSRAVNRTAYGLQPYTNKLNITSESFSAPSEIQHFFRICQIFRPTPMPVVSRTKKEAGLFVRICSN
jgi:hypothetical protein